MSNSFAALIATQYRETHQYILANIVADLSQEQLAWRPVSTAHSIGWLLWHLARWADHLQATIPGMTPELSQRMAARHQLWEAEGLATQWGWQALPLGYAETGTDSNPDTAAQVSLPSKETLLDYAHRAFAAAEEAVSMLDDQQLLERERPHEHDAVLQAYQEQTVTVGGAILSHLQHDHLHLGVMQYLRGLQGL